MITNSCFYLGAIVYNLHHQLSFLIYSDAHDFTITCQHNALSVWFGINIRLAMLLGIWSQQVRKYLGMSIFSFVIIRWRITWKVSSLLCYSVSNKTSNWRKYIDTQFKVSKNVIIHLSIKWKISLSTFQFKHKFYFLFAHTWCPF